MSTEEMERRRAWMHRAKMDGRDTWRNVKGRCGGKIIDDADERQRGRRTDRQIMRCHQQSEERSASQE